MNVRGIVDEATAGEGRALIRQTFASKDTAAVEGLVKRLEAVLGLARLEWPPSLLRAFWEELMEAEPGRARGPIHEARWLNLLGFCLRPGLRDCRGRLAGGADVAIVRKESRARAQRALPGGVVDSLAADRGGD